MSIDDILERQTVALERIAAALEMLARESSPDSSMAAPARSVGPRSHNALNDAVRLEKAYRRRFASWDDFEGAVTARPGRITTKEICALLEIGKGRLYEARKQRERVEWGTGKVRQ